MLYIWFILLILLQIQNIVLGLLNNNRREPIITHSYSLDTQFRKGTYFMTKEGQGIL